MAGEPTLYTRACTLANRRRRTIGEQKSDPAALRNAQRPAIFLFLFSIFRVCERVKWQTMQTSDHATHYQSEYFVPSKADAVDFEYTSKTLLPPQLVESGSSCTDRKPHSARPVIGSTGILRR